MTALDAQKVWTALSADPKFAGTTPPPLKPVFKELVDALPARFVGLVEKPVTIGSFGEAKIAVLKACADIDFVKKVVAGLPEEAFGLMGREGMAEMVDGMLAALTSTFEEIVKDAVAWLEEQGIDEETFLAHPKGGRLDARSLASYRAGTLTVGGLLETQPLALLQNTED